MGLAPATGAPFQSTLSTAPADWTVALVAPTGLLISSNTLTFPAIYPNFPSTPQTLTLTNAGAQPITLSLFGFYGVDKGDFSIASNQCTVSPYLFSGESCTIQITFTPSAVGARSASLSIGSSAPNFPVQVPLTGTGAAKFWDPAGLFAIIAGFYKGGGFTKCDRDQQRSFCYRDWSNHEQYCDLDEQLRNRDSVGIQLHSIGRGEINWIDGTDRNLVSYYQFYCGISGDTDPGRGFTAAWSGVHCCQPDLWNLGGWRHEFTLRKREQSHRSLSHSLSVSSPCWSERSGLLVCECRSLCWR